MTQQSGRGPMCICLPYPHCPPLLLLFVSRFYYQLLAGRGQIGFLTLVDLQRISFTGGVEDDDDSDFISVSSFIIFALL